MDGLFCDDCGSSYGDEVGQISLNLPRDQWLRIKPSDGLCELHNLQGISAAACSLCTS